MPLSIACCICQCSTIFSFSNFRSVFFLPLFPLYRWIIKMHNLDFFLHKPISRKHDSTGKEKKNAISVSYARPSYRNGSVSGIRQDITLIILPGRVLTTVIVEILIYLAVFMKGSIREGQR